MKMVQSADHLLGASGDGPVSLLVLLDLSAAFGVRGTSLDWFSSYPSDRFQFVCIHDVCCSYNRAWSSTRSWTWTSPFSLMEAVHDADDA